MNRRLCVVALVLALGTSLVLAEGEETPNAKEEAAAVFSEADLKSIEATAEKHEFRAEVNRLMEILVHSLYTNKEIFLRELISNANDAIEKLRFLSLTNAALLQPDSLGLEITVRAHREDGTLRIRDTGIGMTRDELVTNLGTIAQSGTVEFMKRMTGSEKSAESPSSLIGQFGVGFYSSFLVADRVTVVSKSHDDPQQHIWESDAGGSFSVAVDPRGNTLGRGTEIILHLKDAEKDQFLDETTLATVIKKYAEFVNFPVKLWQSHEVEHEVEIPPEELKKDELSEEEVEEEVEAMDKKTEETTEEEAAEPEKKTKKVKVQEWGWTVMNDIKPIWVRNPKEITEEEYTNFYKSLTKDVEEPLAHAHFKAEGDAEFRALLYVPKRAPSNLWDPNPAQHKQNIRLFVKHVFVTGDFFEVMPPWLRFIRGVVDSEDLPINVGREQVQESKALDAIKQKLTRKSIAIFQELFKTDRNGKYKEFYEQYNSALKLGAVDDFHNRERLSKLLLFHSSKTMANKGEMTTFEEYLDRMEELNKGRKNKQKDILVMGGESLEAISKSPLLERLVRNGHEVLFLDSPVDEYLCQSLFMFDKHHLVNIAREGVKLDFMIDEEKEKLAAENVQELSKWMQGILSEWIEKVVPSTKLTSTPAIVVSAAWGPTSNMERIMKAQALSRAADKMPFTPKKVLEINPGHPLIIEMHRRVKENPDDPQLVSSTKLLYHTALMTGGYTIQDTPKFANEIYTMMSTKLGVDPAAEVKEVELEKAMEPEEPASPEEVEETTEERTEL